MAMTWMEEMRDRAARVIPTPFADAVDEATSEVNIAPDWERFAQICEFANTKPDNITDIVRAVRRRIDHRLSKVQYFTVLLLQTLIKSCGLPVHKEINETKGILRDLLAVAQKECSADGDREAKEAALRLILNLSYWFDGHSAPSDVQNLAQLANYARSKGVSFDGVDHEEFTVLVEVPVATRQSRRVPHSRLQQAGGASAAAGAAGGAQRTHGRGSRPMEQQAYVDDGRRRIAAGFGEARVVDAIPLEPPTDVQTQAYMDNCMLLAECINTAEQEGTPLANNDFIMSVASQVRQENASLSLIVSSGIELPNIEVLLSITDSQLSVLDRVKASARTAHTAPHQVQQQQPHGGSTTAPQQQPPAPQQFYPPLPQHQTGGHAIITPAHPAPAPAPTLQVAPSHPAAAPPVQYAPPSIDDLFAQVTAAPSQPPPVAVAPTQPPAVTATAAAPHYADRPTTRSAPADATTDVAPSPPAAVAPTRPMAFPRPSQDVRPGGATQEMTHSDGPTTTAPQQGSINDDFDAFLDSRLSGQ